MNFSPRGIYVRVKNNGSEPVKVLWDECAYIDFEQRSHRVLTSGARRITSQLAQAPSPVAPGTMIEEILFPSDYMGSNYLRPLFPSNPTEEMMFGVSQKALIGREIGLLLVTERNGEKKTQVNMFKVVDASAKLQK